jgi:hypothetical protein
MTFEENGMRIYDAEVLGVSMSNADVEKLLVGAQREQIQNTLVLAGEKRKLQYIVESEEIKRVASTAQAETARAQMLLQQETAACKLQLDMAIIDANAKAELERINSELESCRARAEISALNLGLQNDADEQRMKIAKLNQEMELLKLKAQTTAIVEKTQAIGPDLISALSTFGERAMVEKVAEAMGPLSILGGGSVVDILKKILEGTTLGNTLTAVNPPALPASKRSASASNS